MVDTQNFRLAFHGFNRDDVLQFLESEQAKHTMEVNSLKDDVMRLEAALISAQMAAQTAPAPQSEEPQQAEDTTLREQLEALQAENATLREQLEALQTENTTLHEQLEELEAYRRAENVERQARIRAGQMSAQVHTLVDDISNRMDGTQAEMTAAADDLGQALERLQAALDHSRAALYDGAAAFRALQPESEQD